MLIAAMVTPLSLAGKLFGSLLGIAVIATSYYLFSQGEIQKVEGADEEPQPQPAADFVSRIQGAAYWRRPNALLMGLIGLLILGGVWVDPATFPVPFMMVWTGVLAATLAMVVVAIHDLLFVRKRAIQDRMQLLQQNRKELEEDLKEYYRSRSHKGNGHSPHKRF